MIKFHFLLLLLLIGIQLFGQSTNNERIIEIQDEIASLVGKLKQESSVNYMKHFNQVAYTGVIEHPSPI